MLTWEKFMVPWDGRMRFFFSLYRVGLLLLFIINILSWYLHYIVWVVLLFIHRSNCAGFLLLSLFQDVHQLVDFLDINSRIEG